MIIKKQTIVWFIIIFSVLLVLTGCPGLFSTEEPRDGILISSLTFTDPNLAARVNSSGATIGAIYVDELWLLEGSVSDIIDLSGIENLTSLTRIYLGHNNIADLSPLASLTSLTRLDLYNNRINNVSALASLTSLNTLVLRNNSITDVSLLASLINLGYLYLDDNNITTGVASLVTLTNARSIDFYGNTGIPTADLDTLEAALGSGIVGRP